LPIIPAIPHIGIKRRRTGETGDRGPETGDPSSVIGPPSSVRLPSPVIRLRSSLRLPSPVPRHPLQQGVEISFEAAERKIIKQSFMTRAPKPHSKLVVF